MKDYSSWLCPFCKQKGIIAVGNPETKISDATDGGDGKEHTMQLFDHPGCTEHERFNGFCHDITAQESK